MKVAVSAVSEDIKQPVNLVFGRCPGYVIAEIDGKEVKETKFVQNPGMSTGMGAGIAAAQAVAGQGVQAVISGNVGPNAFMVLQQSGIKIYRVTSASVEQALQQFAEGKLEEVKGSTAPGHFGMGQGAGSGAGTDAGGAGSGMGQGAGRGMGRGAGTGAGRGSGSGMGRGSGAGRGIGAGRGRGSQM